jgi:hypothetical protein
MKNNANDTIVMNAFMIGGKKFANIPLTEMKLDMEYQRLETDAFFNDNALDDNFLLSLR